MKIVIENQILPPVYIWSKFRASSEILIEQFDNYNKRTYRNRFIILSQNGPLSISIPLKKGKNRNTPFTNVQISYDKNWISNIKNTLNTCYNSSPFFEFYIEELLDIFHKKHQFLFQLNNDLRDFVTDILEIDTPVNFTEDYIKKYNSEYLDLRDIYSPVIDLKNESSHYTQKYAQVFEYKTGFFPNASIIDLIFNTGNQAALLI